MTEGSSRVDSDHPPAGSRDPVTRSMTRGITTRLRSRPWLARACGVGLAVVSLGFLAALAAVITLGGQLLLITAPLPVQVVFAIPYVVVILTVGTILGAGAGWYNGYWSLLGRIHQTLLAVLGVLFVLGLANLGFVP